MAKGAELHPSVFTHCGIRRRFRGRMVKANGEPRSHNTGHLPPPRKAVACSPGNGGGRPPFYEVGAGNIKSDVAGKTTGERVSLPHGRLRITGVFGSW